MIQRSLLRSLQQSMKQPHILRFIARQHHQPPRSPDTTSVFPQIQTCCRVTNSSANTNKQEKVAETTELFASPKCHAHHDNLDVSYYAIDCHCHTPYSLLPPNGRRISPLPAIEELVPTQLAQSVEHLKCGSCYIYLVGVRQSDEKSSQLVTDTINHLKPEVVFLELCEHRQVFLQKHQDNKTIGAQNIAFRAAFEAALRNDTKLILGDQPFHITVRRILEGMLAMRIWEFMRLSFYLLLQFMEYGKENKVFDINDFVYKKLEELKTFPTLVKPAIYERDLYMSSVLAKIAKEHSLVVAVIGWDHVVGIKKQLEQSVATNTDLSKRHTG